ncbi:MAG TPA: ribonuclease H-like domain-containing protein [Pyrinomonadaceae bacterium]
MRRIFIDIETLPPAECGHAECSGRDPCPDEAYRKLALKGELGRLLCVGLIVEQNGVITQRGVLGRDRSTLRFHLDEVKTLRGVWRQFEGFDVRRDLVIGHNLFDFDLLFLLKRSIVHQVRPPVNLSFARYRSQPVFDTMREWEKWAYARISLNELAQALHLKSSKGDLDGSKVYEAFMKSDHVAIADYCLEDVMLTREIFYKMRFEQCERAEALAKAS